MSDPSDPGGPISNQSQVLGGSGVAAPGEPGGAVLTEAGGQPHRVAPVETRLAAGVLRRHRLAPVRLALWVGEEGEESKGVNRSRETRSGPGDDRAEQPSGTWELLLVQPHSHPKSRLQVLVNLHFLGRSQKWGQLPAIPVGGARLNQLGPRRRGSVGTRQSQDTESTCLAGG